MIESINPTHSDRISYKPPTHPIIDAHNHDFKTKEVSNFHPLETHFSISVSATHFTYSISHRTCMKYYKNIQKIHRINHIY